MEPTVLAGAIEFSPAEIAAILAVLAGLFVVLTSPGWGFVACAAHRRRAARGPGRTWPAALGGALAGLVLCGGVAVLVGPLVESVGGVGFLFLVAATWAACGVLALLLMPARGTSVTKAAQTPGTESWLRDGTAGSAQSGGREQGWGR